MPSSSLFLRLCTTLISACLLTATSASSNQYYAIDTTYSGPTFFDGFSFFSGADPTHGFVDYLSRADALNASLISYGSAQPAKMNVDAATPLTPPDNVGQYYNQDGVGRKSVRIKSVKTWTHGLMVLDIDHMPTSATDGCGTWPAFWTLGSGTWPQNGEIDIIEGANDQVQNFAAGHTGSADKTRQCSVTNDGGSGDLIYSNCNLYSTDPWGNPTNPTGCKIEDKTANSYGKPFNDNKGGVYAMEWTSEYIKTYFFSRGNIPSDIGDGKVPDPSRWTPFGVFSTPCDIDSNYNNMQIIFDTTFCGDFGDATWGSSCAAKTGFDTCAKYVASKPRDFAEAYWQIESLKVYTLKDKPVTTSSTSITSSATSTPVSREQQSKRRVLTNPSEEYNKHHDEL